MSLSVGLPFNISDLRQVSFGTLIYIDWLLRRQPPYLTELQGRVSGYFNSSLVCGEVKIKRQPTLEALRM